MFHIHRTRHRKNHEGEVPHSPLLYSIDALAYAVSLLSLFFTLDQVRLVWIEKNVDGVSLISWIFYTVSAFVWLWYGVLHKDRALVITNFLWVFFSLCIVLGIVLHT